MYEVESLGGRLYAIDEGNGFTLMLPRTSKTFAQTIADALEAAYARGRREMEAEVSTVLQDAGLDYPEGIAGVKDLVRQRDGYLQSLQETE